MQNSQQPVRLKEVSVPLLVFVIATFLGVVGVWIWLATVIDNHGVDNNPNQCPYGGAPYTVTGCRVWLDTYRPWAELGLAIGLFIAWLIVVFTVLAIAAKVRQGHAALVSRSPAAQQRAAERAASRKAEFERQVAETAARDAAQAKAAADAEERKRMAVSARAEAALQASSDRGTSIKFAALGVQVFDGTVYTTAGGLRPLGPLSGASASLNVRKPARGPRRSNEELVVRGVLNLNTDRQKITDQAEVVIRAGSGQFHHKQVSGKTAIDLARHHVERFNGIAASASEAKAAE